MYKRQVRHDELCAEVNGLLHHALGNIKWTGSYEFARMWNMKQAMDGVQDKKLYFTPEQIEAYYSFQIWY